MTTQAGRVMAPQFDRDDVQPYRPERWDVLREAGPVAKAIWAPGTWAVTRHAAVSALLRDRRLGHRMPREVLEFTFGDGPSADFTENSLLNHDPPDHTRLRALMGKAFSASLVRKMRDDIAAIADEMLAPALDGGTFDVVDRLAYPLPSVVICDLLGLPRDDRDEVRRWTNDLVGDDRAASDAAIEWFRSYMGTALAGRVPDPDGDLFQRMLAAEEGEWALTHEEIVDNAILLFVAGFETTRNLIANGVAALLDFPLERDRLLADPVGLAPTAVEEFLRYDGPVPFVQRRTLEPVVVGDVEIKPGRVLLLMLASANHDERAFHLPASLDLGRTPNPHVAFAGGIHFCLGAQLARVEAEVVFRRLATLARSFEGAGERARLPVGMRSYAHVPITVTAR